MESVANCFIINMYYKLLYVSIIFSGRKIKVCSFILFYLNLLPEKQTDFIYTMIGEEFGFIGTIFILLLYSLLILIDYKIRDKDYWFPYDLDEGRKT